MADERGATLTGYALTVAGITVLSLSALAVLEDGGGRYLETTGEAIGQPRESTSFLAPSPTQSQPAGPTPAAPPPANLAFAAPTPGGTPTSRSFAEGPAGVMARTGKKSAAYCLSAGQPVRQVVCDGRPETQFQAWKDEDSGRLKLVLGGQCVTVGDSKKKGSSVQTVPCSDDPAQDWSLDKKGRFKNHLSNLCLDVRGKASRQDGGDLVQWPCRNRDNQKFSAPLP